jgi:chemotaxis response regulator CheB
VITKFVLYRRRNKTLSVSATPPVLKRGLLVRLPVIGTSLAALGLAGADMHFVTPLVGALVGGPKAIVAIKAAMPKGLGKVVSLGHN